MVERGLKKGAIFSEGGLYYKIIQVLDDGNYVSKHISKEAAEVALKATAKPAPAKRKTGSR